MDCALEVFDLIHAVGRQNGSQPSCLKKVEENLQRILLEWFTHYQDGINQLNAKIQNWRYPNFVKSHKLAYLLGSKHLRFWVFSNLRHQSFIAFGCTLSVRYSDYFYDIKKLAEHFNLNCLEMEESLFGFSTAFFPNNQLNIKPEIDQSMRNFDEAKALENFSQTNK